MEKQKTSIDLFLEFIYKYFAQIIFAPLLIGGIIQVANLFFISPQFIRFFSPTQAIADGIFWLVFIILMLFSFMFLMLGSFVGASKKIDQIKENPEKVGMEREKQENKKQTKWSRIYYSLFLCVAIYVYYFFSNVFINQMQEKSFDALKIIFFGVISILLNTAIVVCLIGSFSTHAYYFLRKDKQKNLLFTILVVNFISLLIILVFTNNQNDAINFRILEEKYKCKSIKKSYCRVVYFNDRFIFIERKCENHSKEIIIEKFDALFNNTKLN